MRRWVRDDRGATAVEYGLLLGTLSLVVVGGVTLAGGALSAEFKSIAAFISSH